MSYEQLAYLHLITVVPAFAMGTWLLVCPKGSGKHRIVGRVYLILMGLTALVSLGMPARVGPQWMGHWGFIHMFSVMTLYVVPSAYLAARRGRIRAHRSHMVGLYVGGLVVAGAFAFFPGRLLHGWLWG